MPIQSAPKTATQKGKAIAKELAKLDGRSQNDIARDLGVGLVTVQRLKSSEVGQALIKKEREKLEDRQTKIGSLAKKGVEKTTKLLKQAIDSLYDKLADGAEINLADLETIERLHQTLFTTHVKAVEIGVDQDGSNDAVDEQNALVLLQTAYLLGHQCQGSPEVLDQMLDRFISTGELIPDPPDPTETDQDILEISPIASTSKAASSPSPVQTTAQSTASGSEMTDQSTDGRE